MTFEETVMHVFSDRKVIRSLMTRNFEYGAGKQMERYYILT